jgi:hypothetical protein
MKIIEDDAKLIQRIIEAELEPTPENQALRELSKIDIESNIEEIDHALLVARSTNQL